MKIKELINSLKVATFFIGIGAITQRNFDIGFNEPLPSIFVLLILIVFYLYMSFMEIKIKDSSGYVVR